MDKRTKQRNVEALDLPGAKNIIYGIVIDCIHDGRKLQMTSSEILDGICDVLRAAKLDAFER